MARTKQTAWSSYGRPPLIGCWFPCAHPDWPSRVRRSYLPLASLRAHTVIKDVASRTTLTQSFSNETSDHLTNMLYSFPLHAGVSVVGFKATIGDVQINGVVKEKQQARRDFEKAAAQGDAAALLEQLPEASDVFTSRIGNVPAGETVTVEVVYVGVLNHDAQSDGVRFTIPTFIAPRYGENANNILSSPLLSPDVENAIQFLVDVCSVEGCAVRQLQSPSHPIAVSMGRTSDMSEDAAFMSHRASATLSLSCTRLDKDFVVVLGVWNMNAPKALLETHDSLPNQRALQVTVVPNFQLSPLPCEVVFVVDRSGSMVNKMDMVIKAMTTMLKSLRVGVSFNICSFGSRFSFLWPRSMPYSEITMGEALDHVDVIRADFGGTEMIQPVEGLLSQRLNDLLLNVIVLTDGQIWNQQQLFQIVRDASNNHQCRFFSLGIGHGASTSLVEGLATEGKGFSQFVAEGEPMDRKMVQLLKGALSSHSKDYSFDIKYPKEDDWEMIDAKEASSVTIDIPIREKGKSTQKSPLSASDGVGGGDDRGDGTSEDRFAHVPKVSVPLVLQAPSGIPPLYASARATIFFLLDSNSSTPESVVLRASSDDGPIDFEIQVQDIGKGKTIHQLAARKAISELENGHGWLSQATDKESKKLLKDHYESQWDEMVEREAIRLGVKYQIAGKWCSFIAVEGTQEYEPVSFGGRQPIMPGLGPAPRRQLASKAARKSASSSGMAPRKPLASKAARKSAPSAQPVKKRTGDPVEPAEAAAAPGPSDSPSKERRSARLQAKATTDEEKMYALIRLQKFDGSWKWEQSLLDIIGGKGGPGGSPPPVQKQALVATALAIAFFRHRVSHEADAWELVVQKAVDWLAGQKGVDDEMEIRRASELLS
ncbi:von Willebrand factor type A domain-containing protein [Xylariomycetidae sp. FL2044]|nr:von Willebrand factor type A domain-containing protein [Xylariomycetidae sp. FL2044]